MVRLLNRARTRVAHAIAGESARPAAGLETGRARTSSVDLLAQSPLFDAEWYALRTGVQGDRAALVRHYLDTPVGQRVSPHPLFDAEWFSAQTSLDLSGKDPFLTYLRRKPYGTATHPLFSTVHYRRTTPGAKDHPHGPIAHYVEFGAKAGIPGNRRLLGDDSGIDLREWLVGRQRQWNEVHESQRLPSVSRRELKQSAPTGVTVDPSGTAVDIVLTPGTHPEHLRTTLRTVLAQEHSRWHLLVLDDGLPPEVPSVLAEELEQGTWTVVGVEGMGSADGFKRALARGRGEWIAFLTAGDLWAPDRIVRLLVEGVRTEAEAVADVMKFVRADETSYLSRTGIRAGAPTRRSAIAAERLLLRRSAVETLGVESDLAAAWEFDLLVGIAQRTGVPLVPSVGVTRSLEQWREAKWRPGPLRPVLDPREVSAWADVVLNRAMVDWETEASRERDPSTVSVVIPTYADWEMTTAAVEALVAHAASGDPVLQVIVVDNGNDPLAAAMVDALTLKYSCVEVERRVTNLGYALGNNVAVPRLRGATVVFLNNDTEVQPGWLSPLVDALDAPEVLGVQSLLLYPDGTVQCGGIAFPSTGGLAHGFLQGFPPEDAHGLEELRFGAVTGACLAMRTADFVALQGFDPLFTNGMEDVDLCLRAAELRAATLPGGHFVVRPDSRVVHHESKTPGRHRHYAINRRVFLDRWQKRLPADDVDLWATRGFVVAGHALSHHQHKDRNLGVPEPVLVREPIQVFEGLPRLRWAIKNPAPAGAAGEQWGDTHFAAALAAALRDLGQHVAIDRRDAFDRVSGRHDDVNLVLRGLAPYWPTPENVTLGWVISHPDQLSATEAAAYDRVLAASVPWAAQQSRLWGFDVEPLLQATDDRLFRPDRAAPDTGHPVLFVGSSRGQYRPMVRDAVEAGLPLSVYGAEWEKILARRFLKATYLPNDELGAAYGAAGVVLNDHWDDMRRDGFLSNRLFDAVASGARVLSDDVAGLGDLFGRSVQVVQTPQDLVRLSSLADPDAVFGDVAERGAVADRVRREHSFAARARRLVEVALEARRERGFES